MSAEVDEHGRELDATCSECRCAITDNEAADNGGMCEVCAEDDERQAEREVAYCRYCVSYRSELVRLADGASHCPRCGVTGQ